MSPSGIDFSEAVTASGPSFRICSRSWPKRASDSCMAVAILFRSAATSALNAPPLEAEGEATHHVGGASRTTREPISAHRTIKKIAIVPTDDPRAISRCSNVVIPRCYPLLRFLNLANLVDGSRVRPYPGRWAAAACDDRTDIPLDSYVLHEFGVASPADPTDGLADGPPLSGPWPGPILLPRANVAGLNIWGDDLHPWRCPSSLGSLTRIDGS